MDGGPPRQVLLLGDFQRGSSQTTIDYIQALRDESRHEVFVYDPRGVSRPGWLDLDRFDVVLIHYSIYLLGFHYLDPTWRAALARTTAVKLAFIQDEYRRVVQFRAALRELGVQVLFTCWPQDQVDGIYPPAELPGLEKLTVLTGYVPDYLARAPLDHLNRRPIDVGYRGRDGLWWLGTLYQEKVRIGQEFLARAQGTRLRCDIAWREEDRLYGAKWTEFLRSSRWTLGTESGASVVDLTGEVEARTRSWLAAHPRATFEEARAACFQAEEGRFRQNQVSPRIFEALGFGAGLVLFEGRYSDVVRPGDHYVPLRKDFSNFDDVVRQVEDEPLRRRQVERAHEEVIRSGRYSYAALVRLVDDVIDRRTAGRPLAAPRSLVERLAASAGMVAALPALPLLAAWNESPHLRQHLAHWWFRVRRRAGRFHPLLYVEKARLLGRSAAERLKR